jgi:hypothetical protein
MSTPVHLTVGICLLSAVALFAPLRAEATASVAPGRIQAAVGKSHAVEPAALACTHRRVCRQGAGCAWRKVCKRS